MRDKRGSYYEYLSCVFHTNISEVDVSHVQTQYKESTGPAVPLQDEAFLHCRAPLVQLCIYIHIHIFKEDSSLNAFEQEHLHLMNIVP